MAILRILAFVLLLTLPSAAQQSPDPPVGHQPSAAYQWLDLCLEAAARDVDRNAARPTVLSRTMAIEMTAMFDAWAAYDDRAIGTCLGASFRRPLSERTDDHRQTAIAYAIFRSLLFIHPEDRGWICDKMRDMGFDPDDHSNDPASPVGVGNLVAEALIAYRKNDGANQAGDIEGCAGGAYSDTTGYVCNNPVDSILDPDRWQPITFSDGKGGFVTPGYLTPHWHKVTPFGLVDAAMFRPGPPPKVGSAELKAEADEVLRLNATLTPEQKAIVEFMRDGPRSTGQSGHWLRFAQDVSRRDKQSLEEDVKLYFAVANTAMDAFIACWECKRYYDSSRPWTLIHHYYQGQTVRGWAGPGKGVVAMRGEDWVPYSPQTFITPPFPGYPSGHSTVSAACARTLELFTGSDRFDSVESRDAGVLTEPGVECSVMQSEDGAPSPHYVRESCHVNLSLPTFSATARMAGESRILGGYHIRSDNTEGLIMGKKVADHLWPKFLYHFGQSPAVR